MNLASKIINDKDLERCAKYWFPRLDVNIFLAKNQPHMANMVQ